MPVQRENHFFRKLHLIWRFVLNGGLYPVCRSPLLHGGADMPARAGGHHDPPRFSRGGRRGVAADRSSCSDARRWPRLRGVAAKVVVVTAARAKGGRARVCATVACAEACRRKEEHVGTQRGCAPGDDLEPPE